jgi:ABC-2 type transport system ATP-binding protein
VAPQVVVDSPDRPALAAAVGHIAFSAGVEVSVLHRQPKGLEDAFLALVDGGDSL